MVSDGNGGNNYGVTCVNDTTGVINALAITDPDTALRQAEADTLVVVQYLEGSKKNPAMAVDARIRAEAASLMLQFGRAALAIPRLQAQKAGADQRLADATAGVAAPKVAADADSRAAVPLAFPDHVLDLPLIRSLQHTLAVRRTALPTSP